ADHGLGQVGCLIGVFGQLHPAALPPPPGVDLRFDHHPPAQLFGGGARFVGRFHHHSARSGDAVAAQDFLGLILVDFHGARRFITAVLRILSEGGRWGRERKDLSVHRRFAALPCRWSSRSR